jgi:dsRNA-specific ribonuclease
MNPISRLAQIQQAKKEKEPDYVLLSERGMPRRREFVMQVFLSFMLKVSKTIEKICKFTGWNNDVGERLTRP